jgi:hypothetical protein
MIVWNDAHYSNLLYVVSCCVVGWCVVMGSKLCVVVGSKLCVVGWCVVMGSKLCVVGWCAVSTDSLGECTACISASGIVGYLTSMKI